MDLFCRKIYIYDFLGKGMKAEKEASRKWKYWAIGVLVVVVVVLLFWKPEVLLSPDEEDSLSFGLYADTSESSDLECSTLEEITSSDTVNPDSSTGFVSADDVDVQKARENLCNWRVCKLFQHASSVGYNTAGVLFCSAFSLGGCDRINQIDCSKSGNPAWSESTIRDFRDGCQRLKDDLCSK
jgi:hypothetical protein